MSHNTPLVSIITASYNAEQFIEETILSVRDQDYPRIEHLVVDGGSVDGTVDILRKYPHLRWVSEPDRGQSHAINKGFHMAKGDIVAFLNADDAYMPGAVSTAVSWLQRYPDVGLVYGDQAIVNERGEVQKTIHSIDFELDQLFLHNEIPAQPTVFWHKRILDEVGFLDEELHYAMDYDLWLRIALLYPLRRMAGQCLARFRICPGTKTTSHPDAWPPEMHRVLDRAVSSQSYLALPESAQRRVLASALRHKACLACYQNQPKQAAELFRRASEQSSVLRERDIQVLMWHFAYCAESPVVPDAITLIKELFTQPLPGEIARLRRKALGFTHLAYALKYYSTREMALARKHMVCHVLNLPGKIGNTGNLSIIAQTLIYNSRRLPGEKTRWTT